MESKKDLPYISFILGSNGSLAKVASGIPVSYV